MISFDAAHAAVHYPPDRRFRIWIRPSFLIAAAVLVLLPVLAAWIEFLLLRASLYSACPADLSQQLRRSTWLSAMGALLSLLQLPLCDDADPQRPVDPGRSPSPVLQQSTARRAASGSA